MESEICVCGDAPEKHDEKGCLRDGCSCLGYRTREHTQMLAEPVPSVIAGGRFTRRNKTICHDFVRRDGLTVQCKSVVDEDGHCTNDVDEHIVVGG